MLRRCLCSVAIAMCAFSINGAEGVAGIQCNYEGTQQELNACAYQEYEKEDKLLNEMYKKVMQSLPKKQQHQLKQEQRLWLKKRDPQCKQEAKENEGVDLAAYILWLPEFKHKTTYRSTRQIERIPALFC